MSLQTTAQDIITALGDIAEGFNIEEMAKCIWHVSDEPVAQMDQKYFWLIAEDYLL